jgi:hypothetical protein
LLVPPLKYCQQAVSADALPSAPINGIPVPNSRIATTPQVPPLAYCEQFVSQSGGFSSPEAVFKGGRHMAATEIAAEPLVRQEVRKQYQVGGCCALYCLLYCLL